MGTKRAQEITGGKNESMNIAREATGKEVRSVWSRDEGGHRLRRWQAVHQVGGPPVVQSNEARGGGRDVGGGDEGVTDERKALPRGVAAGEAGADGSGERIEGSDRLVGRACENDLSPKGRHCDDDNSAKANVWGWKGGLLDTESACGMRGGWRFWSLL